MRINWNEHHIPQAARLQIDGQDIPGNTFEADDEAGFIRCYVLSEGGRIRIDAEKETIRGLVTFANLPIVCACGWVGDVRERISIPLFHEIVLGCPTCGGEVAPFPSGRSMPPPPTADDLRAAARFAAADALKTACMLGGHAPEYPPWRVPTLDDPGTAARIAERLLGEAGGAVATSYEIELDPPLPPWLSEVIGTGAFAPLMFGPTLYGPFPCVQPGATIIVEDAAAWAHLPDDEVGEWNGPGLRWRVKLGRRDGQIVATLLEELPPEDV